MERTLEYLCIIWRIPGGVKVYRNTTCITTVWSSWSRMDFHTATHCEDSCVQETSLVLTKVKHDEERAQRLNSIRRVSQLSVHAQSPEFLKHIKNTVL